MTIDDLHIRIVRSEEYENDARWNYKNIVYPFNTLYFVLDGDGFVRAGERVTKLQAGYVYLISNHTLYDCWCESSIHKLYVEFYVETLPGRDIFSPQTGVAENPFDLEIICGMLRANTDDLPDRLWFRGALMQAVSLFAKKQERPQSADQLSFKSLLDDITLNLSAQIRLHEIAPRHGWHPSTLSRAFKQAFGCGLKHYVDLLLLNTLIEQLITTDKTIKALAAQYGFCDPYYLSAFFKKQSGMSPEVYRRRNARSQ